MAFYESAPYRVIEKDGSFEIREYESFYSVAYEGCALGESSGFNELFNYISGQNDAGQKISMTTPVFNRMESSSEGGSEGGSDSHIKSDRHVDFSTMEFVVPKEIAAGRIPLPRDSRLQIHLNEKRRVVSITFSGNANAAKIQKEKARLISWMASKGLEPDGQIYLARYNPPFTPPLFKKNEILIGING